MLSRIKGCVDCDTARPSDEGGAVGVRYGAHPGQALAEAAAVRPAMTFLQQRMRGR